ncbi:MULTISPECIES: hypothetical protein [Bacillus]|uniref:Uncharacterized protein n=3 Tax=Bacillus cereus group TaxID=86661 RepID=A0A9W5KQX5_BACCE|nr:MULTISPECIES: hypothetical protein [Bacillus cereus group]EKS8366075.1 hypothetical protein [Bacillus cereus]AHA75447.1 hypothetical protein YBT1518_33801 [Bacillus thuringiensis YBT-1518]EEM44501.1 hypothetical protein bthur0005_57330 [Bacillus thuringiensis serovar pakistani str. T13001]EJR61679.1 hypothetical protein IK5_06022 [Bacillus cereus VD154]EKS8373238.1 hypothetical protein [Bacillus cereus]
MELEQVVCKYETNLLRLPYVVGVGMGLVQGKEVGIQEGKIQLIQGMHKNGMDIEDIAKFTNMDLSDIRHILGQ